MLSSFMLTRFDCMYVYMHVKERYVLRILRLKVMSIN